jgi:LPXTG-motif cell wall-anchored protein
MLGAVLIIAGVLALFLAFYIKGRVGEEMGNVRSFTSPLSNAGEGGRTAGGFIEGRASGEAGGYMQNAQFLTIGGIILIVAGGAVLFMYGKKKK